MMVSTSLRVPNLDAFLLLSTTFFWVDAGSSTRHYGYKINPKPCKVKLDEGTCMFVWECIKTEGRHLGMCMDGFMFGSCCAHNVKDNILVEHNETGILPTSATPSSSVTLNSHPSSSLTLPASLITSKPITMSPIILWPRPPGDAPFVTRPKPSLILQHNDSTVWLQSSTFPPPQPGTIRPHKPNRPLVNKKPKPRPTTTTTTTSTTTAATTTTTTTTSTTTPTTTSTTSTTTTTTPRPTTTPTTTPRPTTTFAAITASSGNKPSECGVPPLFPRPEVRIVGGRNAPFGRWPWQVSVRRTSFFGFSSTHRCGGALINEQWVATAGHCVDDLLTSQIRIRMGEYDFSSVLEPYPYVERSVVKKVVHPRYNFFTYENDLALVRLEQAVEFYPHISPVCLPGSDDLLIGENGTVTGWGRLSEGGTLPSVLQEVTVPLISNEKCRSMFLKAGRQEYIPDIFLCAGYEEGGRDSCQGDSGGPLQVRGSDGRYFLAGIISWGIGCAEPNLPGVCTRISKFVEWILENVT